MKAAIEEQEEDSQEFVNQLNDRYENFKFVIQNQHDSDLISMQKITHLEKDLVVNSEGYLTRTIKNLMPIFLTSSKTVKNPKEESNHSSRKSSNYLISGMNSIKLSVQNMMHDDDDDKSEKVLLSSHKKTTTMNSYVWIDGEYHDRREENLLVESIMESAVMFSTPNFSMNGEKFPVLNHLTGTTMEKTMDDFTKLGIFHPKHKLKIIWDLIMGVIILYTLILLPLQMAFDDLNEGSLGDSLTYCDWGIDIVFFIDILVHMNTSYISDFEDAYIVNRFDIVKHYVTTYYFYIDLISCIPFDTIATELNYNNQDLHILKLIKIVRILRLIKLYKLDNITRFQNKIEEILELTPAMLNLIATLVQVILISHLVSCMWWGLTRKFSGEAWFDKVDQVNDPLRDAPFRGLSE